MNQKLRQQVFNNQPGQSLIEQGIVAIVLTAVLVWAPIVQADPVDKSDLNNDYTVDILDLQIFATDYLGEDWETYTWCPFYETSLKSEKYFRTATSEKIDSFKSLLNFIADSYNCQVVMQSADKSDLNNDLVIDVSDISIFSTSYLQTDWETVEWCLFYESTLAGLDFENRSTRYFLKHFGLLLSFINDYFACGGGEPPPAAIQLENIPKLLMRIADAANFTGDYYITDPTIGSLFIFDANLVLKGEIKALNKPLGVAINSQGYILIGNNGRDNIEVYDPANGDLLEVFGEGLLKMPVAITLDSVGNIYVTDSRSNSIQVFDSAYNLLRVIGKSSAQGALHFPVDTEIVPSIGGGANLEEVFVADQINNRIQVYDLMGNWLRSFTFAGTPGQNCSWMTGVCEIPGAPPFTRLEALDFDSFGRLHVLDSFGASVLMFDPADGTFLGAYGGYGTEPGTLRVPMDVLVTETNTAIVTSGDGSRIEVFTNP